MADKQKLRNLHEWTKDRQNSFQEKEESYGSYHIYGSLMAILLLTFSIAGATYYLSLDNTVVQVDNGPLIEDVTQEPRKSKKRSKRNRGKTKGKIRERTPYPSESDYYSDR